MPDALRGGFLLGITMLVYFGAMHIGWYGPYNRQVLVALFLAAPLFLVGLWNVIGEIRCWGISGVMMRVFSALLFTHGVISVVFVLQNS